MMKRYFGTCISTIGGAGLKDIANDYLKFHTAGVSITDDEAEAMLDNIGQFSFRKDGEIHAWNPDTISLLQLVLVLEATRSLRSSHKKQTRSQLLYSFVTFSVSGVIR